MYLKLNLYLIYMYKHDLAWCDLQWLIYHQIQTNQSMYLERLYFDTLIELIQSIFQNV